MKQGWLSFMDRRVKERLVGATILLVLIVLIVPEMLSGPKRRPAVGAPAAALAEPVRNVTVDLATNKATSAGEETGASAVAPDSTAPDVPAESAASAGTTPGAAASPESSVRHLGPPPTVTPLQSRPPSPPPLESEASPPKSGPIMRNAAPHEQGASREQGAPREQGANDGIRRTWAVQLGSFASRPNAEKLERQLKAHGFAASLSPSGAGRTQRYRVRVGPMADRAAADRVVSRLKKEGHLASIVAP
jgi:DedD protein